jgi:ribose transport system substrate-binding protein
MNCVEEGAGMSSGRATFHVGESCAFADGPAVGPITRGQRQRAEELGWRFSTLDAALSEERQVEQIDELVALPVDALTAYTLDQALAEPAYVRAAAVGIRIVTFGSPSPSAATVIRQKVDSYACAADAAAYISDRVPNGRVLVIGGPPIPALAARTANFTAAAAARGLQILAHGENIGDIEETARPIVRSLIDHHGNIDAIWCFNDYTALGAAKELALRGLPVCSGARAGVILSGIGGIPAAIHALRDGQMTFTYDSQPVAAGRAAIDALETILLHKRSPGPEVWIDFVRYDLSNVGDHLPW